MTDTFTFRYKLYLIVIVPLLVLAIYSLNLFIEKKAVLDEMDRLEKLSHFALKISDFVHEIQKERGVSSLFLASKEEDFSTKLSEQRLLTNERLSDLTRWSLDNFEEGEFGKEFQEKIRIAITELRLLDAKRNAISSRTISLKDSINYLTVVNHNFLEIIESMSHFSTTNETGNIFLAYHFLQDMKEHAGIIRAILSAVFPVDTFDPGLYMKFMESVNEVKFSKNHFLHFVSPKSKVFFFRESNEEIAKEVDRMQRISIEKGIKGGFEIDPKHWFEVKTKEIDNLGKVVVLLSREILEVAGTKYKEARHALVISISLSLVAILFVVVVMRSLVRNIAGRQRAEDALSESEQLFRNIFNNSAIGISLLNQDWEYMDCNPQVCKMVGYTNEELKGKTLAFTSDPSYIDDNIKLFEELKERKRDSYEMEKRYIRKDGSAFWGKLCVSLFKSKNDTSRYLIAMLEDITERKLAKAVFRQSHDRLEERVKERTKELAHTTEELRKKDIEYRMAQEIGKVGSFTIDPKTLEHTWSDQIYTMLGLMPGEIPPTYKAYREYVHLDERKHLDRANRETFAGKSNLDVYYRIVRKDGETRHIHTRMNIECKQDGEPVTIFGYSQDITERKQAEIIHEQFSNKLVESREEERKRIASEIHDGIGQNLVVIEGRIQKFLKTVQGDLKRKDVLNQILEILQQTTDEVREIISALHPHQLDQLGLEGAIDSVINQARDSSNITFSVGIHCVNDLLPKEHEIHLYRIIQECIRNILQHSGATSAKMTLRETKNVLSVRVRDNGKGFAFDPKNPVGLGFGLTGMYERAKIIQGSLQIESSIGEGTTLIIRIPLHKEKIS